MITFSAPEARSPRTPQTFGPPQVAVECDPVVSPAAVVGVVVEPAYSIRDAVHAGTRCARCREATGSGPVGYHGEEPICDLCLLEGSSTLGMLLALVAVVRSYGAVEDASETERRDALAELGAFARIYERFAAKSGPARRFLPRLSTH